MKDIRVNETIFYNVYANQSCVFRFGWYGQNAIQRLSIYN